MKVNLHINILCILTLFNFGTAAQTGCLSLEFYFGNFISSTADGGYVVSGNTSFTSMPSHGALIKWNASGNLDWRCEIFDDTSSMLFCVRQLTDGRYIACGNTRTTSNGQEDGFVVKVNSNGTISWTKTIGGALSDGLFSVITTMDGGFALAGITNSFGAGSWDAYIVKLDSNGTIQWTKTVGDTNYERGASIIQTHDSGYLIAGVSSSFNFGQDLYLIKLDSAGILQWSKTMRDSGSALWANSIIQTADGGYAIAGNRYPFGFPNSYDLLAVRLDSSCNILWSKTVGRNKDDTGYNLVECSDGSLVIAGESSNNVAFDSTDIYAVKFDVAGNVLWTTTAGSLYYDRGIGIIRTVDNGFIISGYTSAPTPPTRLIMVKLDSLGNGCVGCNISSGGADTVRQFTVNFQSSLVNAGGTLNNITSMGNNSPEFLTPLCGSISSTEDFNDEVTILLYPNPASDKLFLKRISSDSDIKITISSIFGGKIIETILQKDMPEFVIDLTNLPSGLYLVSVQNIYRPIVTKKFIKL